MTRVWNTPIFIIATVYFIVDGRLFLRYAVDYGLDRQKEAP